VKPVDANKSNLVANLCIIHGFGHNSTAFYEMAYEFAKQGINCHLIDLRSHGLSGGTRFDFNVENMHTDIITLIKQAESDVPDLPLFIFGHSLGGGLVSSLFINNQYLQVHGIILSSPLLGYPLNMEIDHGKLFFLSRFGNSLKVSSMC
jgi:alpha-beta hydrolase superfamily lysophospholipase